MTDEDSFEIVVPYLDTDGDGIADDFDDFPTDATEQLTRMGMALGTIQTCIPTTLHFGRK
uniref:Uncharacterized protein n=1 Tax=uncultured archaeon MedDCM-OCT-S04-C140 TaxID=743085 RepID=D6PB50_9ARCH|nr:hypothetical protein [uncultured archaeon MedDCM-OCT-S04-C140]